MLGPNSSKHGPAPSKARGNRAHRRPPSTLKKPFIVNTRSNRFSGSVGILDQPSTHASNHHLALHAPSCHAATKVATTTSLAARTLTSPRSRVQWGCAPPAGHTAAHDHLEARRDKFTLRHVRRRTERVRHYPTRHPLPWINYLGTRDYIGLISNTGGGYSFYRDARFRRLTRYRYNNVPFDEGGRYVYLRDNQSGEFWSPTWQPTRRDLQHYT